MLAAARPEDRQSAARSPRGGRIRRARDPGGSSLLRLGGDVQPAPTRSCRPPARAQGREHREREARYRRGRQYRLPRPDRERHAPPRCASRGTPRLGNGRADAPGAHQRLSAGRLGVLAVSRHIERMKKLVILTLAALWFVAAGHPASADQTDGRLDKLFADLRATSDPVEGEAITDSIWQIWYETDNTK